MAVEVCTYKLTLRGVPVGTHVVRTQQRGQLTHIEGRLLLQGSLGQSTTTQQSRGNRRRRTSLGFKETTEKRGENRSYEVSFDTGEGLVKASRGPNDQAVIPYLRPYRDPLLLLYELRELGERSEPYRIPMIGKDVTVLYLGTAKIETSLGERSAYAYRLHPGNSYVYVDIADPHSILQMRQPIDGQLLDASLIKIDQEEEMPKREEDRPRKGRKRRRRRRRR